MVARQLAASVKNLAIVRQRESATGIRVIEKRTRTRTGIATVKGKKTGTASGNGTEIMTATVTVIVIATATVIVNVIGRENGTATATVTVTATVIGSETVAPGTTVGMMTTRDGHRVTTVVIVNGIGRVTPREIVVTETVIGMPHEGQARRSGVQGGRLRKTEAATMSRERSARRRTMNEVRKCVGFSFLSQSLKLSNAHA
jgi:hypothetical protein